MTVAATIVVHFGDDVADSAFGVAMLDDVLNVDAAGEVKTSFAPGDQIHFLVQHDPSLRVDRVAATHGTIVQLPDKDYELTGDFTFAEPAEAQDLQIYHRGAVTQEWFGPSGIETRAGLSVANRQVQVAAATPCLVRLTYHGLMKSYRLHAPNVTLAEDETYPVAIVIYMENAA